MAYGFKIQGNMLDKMKEKRNVKERKGKHDRSSSSLRKYRERPFLCGFRYNNIDILNNSRALSFVYAGKLLVMVDLDLNLQFAAVN